MYAIREGITIIGGTISRDNGGGEWWDGQGWTPCSDRALSFESEQDAEEERKRECDRHCLVVEIDD